jgi:hypothetical protein
MALFFTYVLPLILPTAIYVLWRLIVSRHPAGASTDGTSAGPTGGAAALASGEDLWRDAPWPWLAAAGALLLAAVLLLGVFLHGSPPAGHYVPPRLEDGHIVPGELLQDGPDNPANGAQ